MRPVRCFCFPVTHGNRIGKRWQGGCWWWRWAGRAMQNISFRGERVPNATALGPAACRSNHQTAMACVLLGPNRPCPLRRALGRVLVALQRWRPLRCPQGGKDGDSGRAQEGIPQASAKGAWFPQPPRMTTARIPEPVSNMAPHDRHPRGLNAAHYRK